MTTKELDAGGNYALLPSSSAAGILEEDIIEQLWPEELTDDQEFKAALKYLEEDQTGSAHLTPFLTDRLMKGQFDESVAGTVLSHFQTCEWCPQMLRESLQFCGVTADHPAFALLNQPVPYSSETEKFTETEVETLEIAATAEVAVAFKGWVEQIIEGMATLRLVDQEGQRSVATYAVTDLQRDHIPAEVGTAFRCQVVRERAGLRVTFQPIPRRIVPKAGRKQLEDEMTSAYSTLKNDY